MRREPRHRRRVEPRWQQRPLAATALRVAVVAGPFGASLAVALTVARVMGAPEGAAERALWWIGVLGASMAALVVCDRAARRLLPLAALLELSLIFPDRAPSRFGVALRSGSTGRLRDREVEALRRGEQEPAEAARTILALATSLGAHDRDTRGHSERVRAYADLIAAELGLDSTDRDRLHWAALLHDLGKLTVPAHTLNSTEELSEQDWDALRRHPVEGARLAAPLRSWLGPWADAIEQHHERFDGSGYPYGVAGEELSLGARIVAVADSYDAMTSPRSYTTPRSAAAARQELAAQAGIHFDPAVVRAFLAVSLGRLRWVMGPLAFLAAVPLALPAAGLRRGIESAGRTAALGTVSLAATVSVVQPPSIGPELGPAQVPLARAPLTRPAAAAPRAAGATTTPTATSGEATAALSLRDEVAAATVASRTGATATPTVPSRTGATATPTVPPPPGAAAPPALDTPTAVIATTDPPPATTATTAPPAAPVALTTATAAAPAPTATTATTAAPTTPTTTAPPTTTTTCPTVALESSRPCLPPRRGHTSTSTPAPTPP